jgi:hypothetical protein
MDVTRIHVHIPRASRGPRRLRRVGSWFKLRIAVHHMTGNASSVNYVCRQTPPPRRLAAPEVPDGVPSVGGDEDLLAGRGAVRGAVRLAIDLELDVALDDHDDLVGVVHVVGPDLARRINPEPAREAALLPGPFDSRFVHADMVALGAHRRILLREYPATSAGYSAPSTELEA